LCVYEELMLYRRSIAFSLNHRMSIFHGDNAFAELQSSSLVIFTRITSDRSWEKA
jgi:hypothetical protein